MAKVQLNCGGAIIEVVHEKERTLSEFLARLVEQAMRLSQDLPPGIKIQIRDPAGNFNDVEVEHEPVPQFLHSYVPSDVGRFCDVCGYGRNESLKHRVD